jgi:hypothetical protein
MTGFPPRKFCPVPLAADNNVTLLARIAASKSWRPKLATISACGSPAAEGLTVAAPGWNQSAAGLFNFNVRG